MSGRVLGGAPWMRAAVADFAVNHPDMLADIEAQIPDGCGIAIFCGGRPRPLGATLGTPAGPIRVDPIYHSVGAACYAVLNKAAVPA